MNIPFYNAKEPEKEAILRSFLTNDTVLTIFATSALSLGVDFDIVRFTLHLPPFYGGLIEFI
jgi:superfamily II DNA helicase RecQ